MKNLTFICFIYSLLSFSSINAQEVAPLQLGNIWVYDQKTSLARITIIDTSMIVTISISLLLF